MNISEAIKEITKTEAGKVVLIYFFERCGFFDPSDKYATNSTIYKNTALLDVARGIERVCDEISPLIVADLKLLRKEYVMTLEADIRDKQKKAQTEASGII